MSNPSNGINREFFTDFDIHNKAVPNPATAPESLANEDDFFKSLYAEYGISFDQNPPKTGESKTAPDIFQSSRAQDEAMQNPAAAPEPLTGENDFFKNLYAEYGISLSPDASVTLDQSPAKTGESKADSDICQSSRAQDENITNPASAEEDDFLKSLCAELGIALPPDENIAYNQNPKRAGEGKSTTDTFQSYHTQGKTIQPSVAAQDLPSGEDFSPWSYSEQRNIPFSPNREFMIAQNTERSSYSDAAPAQKSGVHRALSIVNNIIFYAVCLSLVVGSALFAASDNPSKSYFGYRIYNVLTNSMTPNEDGSSPSGGFKKGAVIIVKLCNPEDIKVGDIITFNPNANDENSTTYLTHRVIEIKDELNGKQGIYFVTQGDANNSPDPSISGSMLIGKKVFHIPAVGDFLQMVREHFVLALITIICFFACIFVLRWYFAKPETETERQEKKRSRA